jgi:hypothetical protein
VKVAADRFGEDRFQNALVLVTHRCTGALTSKQNLGPVYRKTPRKQAIAVNGE